MRKFVKVLCAATAVAWVFASPASADTVLTIQDGNDATWTLTVEDACQTTCDVSIEIDFATGSDYLGSYVDSVQFKVDGSGTGAGNPSAVTLADTNAGPEASWDFDLDESLSGGNQCNGNANNAVCGEWISGGTGGGFLIDGTTLFWDLTVNWAGQTTMTSGNIRGAFNNEDGSNFATFSPDSTGTISTTTTDIPTTTTTDIPTTTENIPEPTILTLLGAGLVMAGRRLRKRTK